MTLCAGAAEPRPALKDFLGVCGHTVAFKPELYAPVCSLVRDYHPTDWDLGKDTAVLPKLPFAKNGVNWAEVYGSWQARGFRTDACLQIDSTPPQRWKNIDQDAFAYGQAFAAQFGPGGTTPRLEAVEIGNEPGNYSDPQYIQTFRALARGLHAGDPKLRIATCNLAPGKADKYAKPVADLLDLAGLYDVLTIHTYAQLEPWPTWRRSFPEDPRLNYLKDVSALAQWRDAHAAGKPIWITEFGYDATTKKPDPKSEFAKWVGSTEEEQARYLVRSTLLFMALPVQRAYIYFFNDDDTPHIHGSSGLTRNFVPKPAFHALAHLQTVLGDYHFSRVLLAKPDDVYAYEFAPPAGASQNMIVLWSPTGSNRKSTTSLNLSGWKIDQAQTMPLDKGAPTTSPIPSPTSIPITESPLYLHLIATP